MPKNGKQFETQILIFMVRRSTRITGTVAKSIQMIWKLGFKTSRTLLTTAPRFSMPLPAGDDWRGRPRRRWGGEPAGVPAHYEEDQSVLMGGMGFRGLDGVLLMTQHVHSSVGQITLLLTSVFMDSYGPWLRCKGLMLPLLPLYNWSLHVAQLSDCRVRWLRNKNQIESVSRDALQHCQFV